MSKALEQRKIGNTSLSASFIGFGSLEIGRNWGVGTDEEKKKPSEETAASVLNEALDSGISLIDTARAYHRSEERIGAALASRRSEYVLSSKCGEHSNEPDTYYDFSYDAVKASIDKSLILLKTDVIDIMQIHFGPDADKVIDDGETVSAMKDAQKEGKVRFLGASGWDGIIRKCLTDDAFDVFQVHYNLLNRDNEAIIEECHERGKGIFIQGGLAKGLLTPKVLKIKDSLDDITKTKVEQLLALVDGNGEQLMALALEFLYGNPGISSVLLGSKNIEHLKTDIRLLTEDFDDTLLDKALDITR